MSSKKMNANIQYSYLRNNRIRTKLLLFIDNEIQSKIKQNNQNLKFNCEDESQIKICFEETFTQKQTEKYDFSSSDLLKSKKNLNSDKSFSTVDDSPKKIPEKSYKKRCSNHSKTLMKECKHSKKLFDDTICFHKKIYSIKNILRQSSTFLILPKQKKGVEYLKTLCKNLKLSKSDKKSIKRIRSISNTKSKLLSLSKDKKNLKKSNEIKLQKSKKDNEYIYSLFKKPQKDSFALNSKKKISRKSTNLVLIKNKHKE